MAGNKKSPFPKDFLWGASTSAHQVEGGNHNQWTVWELANASRLAKESEKLLSWRWQVPNFEEIKGQAKDPANYVSGRGVDHYNRYREDFGLVKELNLKAFRFSIEWSRIEPREGQWNQAAIDYYRNYIKEIRKRGIAPVLNVWHWTLPVWFSDKGGFKYRRNLKFFDRFMKLVAREYANLADYVITLNEPNVYATFSYQLGLWPPQEKNPLAAFMVYWNLKEAHKRAYEILKRANPKLPVGVAAQLGNIQAKSPRSLFDELSTRIMRYGWNWWFLQRIRRYQDFIGINYYFTDYYNGWFKRNNPTQPVSDLGWYMEPEGLYPLLLRAWSHYKKPIIVTETGVADRHDEYRRWWIEETVVAMERALSEGVDVKGYFHWSLLDNFEWAHGWWPKFGLVAVDREHGMKRTIRQSAKWFADKIERLS